MGTAQNPQKDWGENAVVAGISKQLSSHYKTPLMTSLKEVRNQLLISHDDGVINDKELLLLYDLNEYDNVDLTYNSYPGFDFDDLEDDESLSEFHPYKSDVPFLAEVLGIPEIVECYQRSISSGLEALCIFLKRHSYPCRYSDMIARFGKPVPVLCMINNYMIDYIYQAHSHRILQWNDSILQSKLNENIIGRCLSTGATKFFKLVLADKKNQNGYISCGADCPFKSGQNIFLDKLFDF